MLKRKLSMLDYNIYIDDIKSAISKIEKYTKGMDFEKFSSSGLVQDAVIRNLEIIGEAVKKIPTEVRKNYDIEWKKIAGIRDILMHKYSKVNLEIIWDVVENKLTQLKKNL